MLQLFGWVVGANTMLEYLLAGSTVAKGFASYFTTLIGAGGGAGEQMWEKFSTASDRPGGSQMS